MKVEFTEEEKNLPFMSYEDVDLGRVCKVVMARMLPAGQDVMVGAFSACNLLVSIAKHTQPIEMEVDGYKISVFPVN